MPLKSKPADPVNVTAAVIIIGDEILSGRTQDVNVQFLAQRLGTLGIDVMDVRMIPDHTDTIVAAVNAVRHTHTYVFTTGGIGPTHDDITTDAIGAAFGVPVEENPEALALLQSHYTPQTLNAARRRMARIPQGARLIQNPVSKAPGYQIGNVFVLAGVPKILQAMFDDIDDRLSGGARTHSVTVTTFLTEGWIADTLTALQHQNPTLRIGSYPYFQAGKAGVSIVLRGKDPEKLADVAGVLQKALDEIALAQSPRN